MKKFHQIPTESYIPISHDRRYLFDQYDRIANFLANNLDKDYKSILAKPVQNGQVVDWFSIYENLENLNSQKPSNVSLTNYWEFHAKINQKIEELNKSSDSNSKNWALILSKVFDQSNNLIFSNGADISIIWGWKFDNFELRKPSLDLDNSSSTLGQINNDTNPLSSIDFPKNVEPKITKDETEPESIEEKQEEQIQTSRVVEEFVDTTEDDIIDNPVNNKIEDEQSGFRRFLIWFASNFWWLLGALLLFIIFSLLFNSCNNGNVNERLNLLEDKADKCCN